MIDKHKIYTKKQNKHKKNKNAKIIIFTKKIKFMEYI